MIKVIETTTAERHQEIQDLFNSIKPLLDDGYSYMGALVHIGKVKPSHRSAVYHYKWFHDLKTYGKERGYPYHEYSGKRRK